MHWYHSETHKARIKKAHRVQCGLEVFAPGLVPSRVTQAQRHTLQEDQGDQLLATMQFFGRNGVLVAVGDTVVVADGNVLLVSVTLQLNVTDAVVGTVYVTLPVSLPDSVLVTVLVMLAVPVRDKVDDSVNEVVTLGVTDAEGPAVQEAEGDALELAVEDADVEMDTVEVVVVDGDRVDDTETEADGLGLAKQYIEFPAGTSMLRVFVITGGPPTDTEPKG